MMNVLLPVKLERLIKKIQMVGKQVVLESVIGCVGKASEVGAKAKELVMAAM